MATVLEGQSIPIDVDAAVAALDELRPLLERLSVHPSPDEIARGLPDDTATLAENAVDDYDDGDGAVNFVQALLLARQLGDARVDDEHEGSLLVDTDEAQAAIHHGSLVVRGRLELNAHLIVLGDLRVEGRVRDLTPWTRLIVTGNLRCAAIWSGSPIWVGGRIDAEVAFLERRGQIFTGEGMRARLVIQSPESRDIAGELDAEHHSTLQEWRHEPSAALARLRSILLPQAMEPEGDTFSPTRLLALVEAGKPYLQQGS